MIDDRGPHAPCPGFQPILASMRSPKLLPSPPAGTAEGEALSRARARYASSPVAAWNGGGPAGVALRRARARYASSPVAALYGGAAAADALKRARARYASSPVAASNGAGAAGGAVLSRARAR